MIRKEDLEGLIGHMAAVARERGLKPEDLAPVVTEAAARYNRAQEGEISTIYSSLANEPWFVESFQMAIKSHGIGSISIDVVRNAINRVLDTNLRDSKRGEYGDVYVVLEEAPQVKVELPKRKWYPLSKQAAIEAPRQQRRARLYSYGQAHNDVGYRGAIGRVNTHLFVVDGDYGQLQRVLQSFIDEPSNLRQFAQAVFGWKNEEATRMANLGSNGSEPDLFKYMKKLITYSPEKGAHQQIYTPKV